VTMLVIAASLLPLLVVALRERAIGAAGPGSAEGQ
jgi:hypothetical protein